MYTGPISIPNDQLTNGNAPNSYDEFLMLFNRTVAEKTKPGQRQDIEEKAYTFHAYGRTEGVAGVIVTDGDYPALVAHQLLGKIVDEFLAKYPRTAFSDPSLRENACPLPQLKEYIIKYQDPGQADSIMKIQQELDETKIVLHKTVSFHGAYKLGLDADFFLDRKCLGARREDRLPGTEK